MSGKGDSSPPFLYGLLDESIAARAAKEVVQIAIICEFQIFQSEIVPFSSKSPNFS